MTTRLFVIAPWTDNPPRLIPATFASRWLGCIAGPVSHAAPVIVLADSEDEAKPVVERLKAAGYEKVVVQMPEMELPEMAELEDART